MDCEFCSVSAFNGRRYRQRPVSEVLDEIESIPQRLLFFLDDNLIGYGKKCEERAIQLFTGMIERKLNKRWWCQVSMNFADSDEVMRLAAKAGCRMVLIGVEAENRDALRELNKRVNISSTYDDVFKRINKHGIVTLGSFIAGMDVDTVESIKARADYALHNKNMSAFIASFLTPLPGTRLYDKMKGRLLYSNYPADWCHFDMTEVVYKPANMTPEELQSLGRTLVRRNLSKLSMCRKFLTTLGATHSLEAAIWAEKFNRSFHKMAYNAI